MTDMEIVSAMRSTTRTFFLVALASTPTFSVIMNPTSNSTATTDVWTDCWQSQTDFSNFESFTQDIGTCMKHRLYLGLTESVDQQCVDIGDGVTFVTSGDNTLGPRDLFPLGEEPSSFRGLADAFSTFLSRRGIRWDLSHMYPGLAMRIGPTLTGEGILEFNLERRLDYYDRAQLGPGQQLIRRTILPRLLGFRMSLMSMLPIMFGILIYIAKNAFIFSKLTLVISTLLALKSLFFLQHLRPSHAALHDHFSDNAGASEAVSFIGGPRPQPHSLGVARPDLILQMFAAALPPFKGVNDIPYKEAHGPVFGGPHEPFRDSNDKHDDHRFRGSRNFAWQK